MWKPSWLVKHAVPANSPDTFNSSNGQIAMGVRVLTTELSLWQHVSHHPQNCSCWEDASHGIATLTALYISYIQEEKSQTSCEIKSDVLKITCTFLSFLSNVILSCLFYHIVFKCTKNICITLHLILLFGFLDIEGNSCTFIVTFRQLCGKIAEKQQTCNSVCNILDRLIMDMSPSL